MRRLLLLLVPLAALQAEQPYSDRTHHSDTFGGPRHYRIFLPPDYETSGKRYPAVEGTGNGNGILEPGEQATIWVKLAQGLDPFDKNNWRRVKVHTSSPWLNEIADIQEDRRREWTSAQSRTSLVELWSGVPPGTEISVVLDCESWSFYFTPDVRYGKEPLYQAFQFHKRHLFCWKWTHR